MITLMIFYKVQIKTDFVTRHSKHLLVVVLVHSPVAISVFSYFAQCSILLVFLSRNPPKRLLRARHFRMALVKQLEDDSW